MMMRLVGVGVVAGAVTAAAAVADVQPYNIVQIGFGIPSPSFGQPIYSSAGLYYQHPTGDNYPPHPTLIQEEPLLEWDSYIGIGLGPADASAPGQPTGYGLMGNTRTTGHFVPRYESIYEYPDTGELHGSVQLFAGADNERQSLPTPGGYWGTFFARLTVPAGATLSGASILPYVANEHGTMLSYDVELDGPAVTDPRPEFFDDVSDGTYYRARSYLTASIDIPGFGPAHVYDLYIERDGAGAFGTLPSPGAVSLAVCAGVFGIRRRRG